MAASKSETRFWHFADLHLGEHEGCSEGPCHACIAERVLAALARELRATPEPPHLILFAGDIFNLPGEATSGKRTWDEQRIAEFIEQAAKPLKPLLAAARKRRVAVVGVSGDAKHDPPATEIRKALRWVSLLTKGSAPELHYGVWVTGRPGSVARNRKLEPEDSPSILLTHCGTRPAGAKGFSYYALGHLHEFGHDGAIAAHPGHLVSRWDGPGKAWPTYFIRGTLNDKGQVRIWPVPLEQRPYVAPATRQFYTEHEYAAKTEGLLVLVHAPAPAFFARRGLEVTLDWPKKGKWGPRRAIFHYDSPEMMQAIVRRVAMGCPNDVFVTPSPRVICYGRQLGDSVRLAEFAAKIHKRTAGTQTSDRAGRAWGDPNQRATLKNLARGKVGKALRDNLPPQSNEPRRDWGVPLCAGYPKSHAL